jgi:hypothetical protein
VAILRCHRIAVDAVDGRTRLPRHLCEQGHDRISMAPCVRRVRVPSNLQQSLANGAHDVGLCCQNRDSSALGDGFGGSHCLSGTKAPYFRTSLLISRATRSASEEDKWAVNGRGDRQMAEARRRKSIVYNHQAEEKTPFWQSCVLVH